MVEQIAQVMDPLPPLRATKRPWLAFVPGFLFNGIALGVYFRSWVDLIAPTVILRALIATLFALVFDATVSVVLLWQLRAGTLAS